MRRQVGTPVENERKLLGWILLVIAALALLGSLTGGH